MSSVFSKSKEKRPRSSSSEANNSFVKNVTSRVSGLLPATITRWFSSPSSSTANGSVQTADATDSSTEDEAPESPDTAQPAAKRMRLSPAGTYSQYGASETNCITTNETIDLEPYGTVQSPPGRTTFRRETNFVSTPLRSDESAADLTERDSTVLKRQSVSTTGPSVAKRRKSLFGSPNSDEASMKACAKTACNTMRDPSEPCFKPSLLGSPFYPGRTMYGGASSSYVYHPNIKHRRNALVNETSTSDNTISQATKRIMDLLENYSSPLAEAKRIPPYSRPALSDTINRFQGSSSPAQKTISYKTQELHVPSIASILRLKQRSRLMDTTTAARQLIASHSSTRDYLPYPSPREQEQQPDKASSNKLTTKVKTKLTRPKRGEASELETELPTPVNLPSAVLQIDQNNLPKFSFGSLPEFKPIKLVKPVDRPVMNIDKQGEDNTIITETPLRNPETVISKNPYRFSSPVKLSCETPQSVIIPTFSFGSPERSIDKVGDKEANQISCVVGAPKASETSSKPDGWKGPDCSVSNKDVEQCVKATNNKKSAKCAVCKLADSQKHVDKCINCEKVVVNNVNKLPEQKPEESGKWKCEDCWVGNVESAADCCCCGAANPKKPKIAATNNVGSGWKCDDCWVDNVESAADCVCCGAAKPKPKPTTGSKDAAADWKCNDCWLKNKGDLDICGVCGAAKPGAQSTPAAATTFFNSPIVVSEDTAFKSLVETQTSKWECPSCLVRNDIDKARCACCESDKPGTTNEPVKTTFNFGVTSNTSFKFGIDPKAQEAPKPAQVEPVESKKEQSETNNNVLPNTPTFSFGIPAKKADEPDAPKIVQKTDSAPMNFSFGIPKSTIAPIFGASKPADPPSKADDDGPNQEVPSVIIVPKNLFTAPTTAPSVDATFTQPKPVTTSVSIALSPASNVEKSQSFSAPTNTATAAETPTGFNFKMSANMFAAPTTAPSTVMFGAPVKTSTATSASLFQAKSEPTASMFAKTEAPSSVSLFQKNEAATTTAPPSLGATAPLFSFGNSTQNSAPQPEKPKFNFTFGGNKTETPSIFQPNFAPESKFALPANNAISSALGGNGLTTGNSLGANVIPAGNGLSINPISQSGNPMTNNLQIGVHNPTALFGAPAQKENMWSAGANPSNNMFASNTNTTTNPLQKPAAFSFGTSTPFNSNNNDSMSIGSTASATNVFGMANNNAPSMFSAPQPAGGVFGSPQPASNPQPALGMFGTPSVGATPTFGTPNQSIPSFEAPSLTPAPAPAFNFGAPQSTTVFGFGGQQQQQQQPQQAGGVYSFGGSPAGGLQFSIGAPSNANPGARRVRKAYRRNPQK